MNNLTEVTILIGIHNGEDVLLPQIVRLFEFKSLQFPIRLAFAMTTNKAQGQYLQVV